MCSLRLPFWLNAFTQNLQTYGLSLVSICTCDVWCVQGTLFTTHICQPSFMYNAVYEEQCATSGFLSGWRLFHRIYKHKVYQQSVHAYAKWGELPKDTFYHKHLSPLLLGSMWYMKNNVPPQISFLAEGFSAKFAFVRFISRVYTHVQCEVSFRGTHFTTHAACPASKDCSNILEFPRCFQFVLDNR